MKRIFCCAQYIFTVVLLFVKTWFKQDQFQSGGVSGLMSFNSILKGEELDKTQGIYGDVALILENGNQRNALNDYSSMEQTFDFNLLPIEMVDVA